ncbi:MAG: CcoQ/FixQ family Cbb3-type cytochrome c oxidase assembly chaperone [Pseudomonadota bacterium]
MAIDHLFDNASSVMTLLSFLTFMGILWWTFVHHRSADFDGAAALPFADDADGTDHARNQESGHV